MVAEAGEMSVVHLNSPMADVSLQTQCSSPQVYLTWICLVPCFLNRGANLGKAPLCNLAVSGGILEVLLTSLPGLSAPDHLLQLTCKFAACLSKVEQTFR